MFKPQGLGSVGRVQKNNKKSTLLLPSLQAVRFQKVDFPYYNEKHQCCNTLCLQAPKWVNKGYNPMQFVQCYRGSKVMSNRKKL